MTASDPELPLLRSADGALQCTLPMQSNATEYVGKTTRLTAQMRARGYYLESTIVAPTQTTLLWKPRPAPPRLRVAAAKSVRWLRGSACKLLQWMQLSLQPSAALLLLLRGGGLGAARALLARLVQLLLR